VKYSARISGPPYSSKRDNRRLIAPASRAIDLRMRPLLVLAFAVAGFGVSGLAIGCGEDIDIAFEDCEALRACAEDPACDPGPNFEVECAEED